MLYVTLTVFPFQPVKKLKYTNFITMETMNSYNIWQTMGDQAAALIVITAFCK